MGARLCPIGITLMVKERVVDTGRHGDVDCVCGFADGSLLDWHRLIGGDLVGCAGRADRGRQVHLLMALTLLNLTPLRLGIDKFVR